MAEYGYIRVSSKDQNEDRQLIAMKKAGVKKSHLYLDKQSGKDFDRPGYKQMLEKLREGDVVYIKSIDRLGRNYREILDEWRELVYQKKVDLVVLDMPLLDTRRGKDLVGTFLSDVVLQLFSFVAENERNTIRSRQEEGIQAAKMRGVRFGRPPVVLPDDICQVYQKWKQGQITAEEAAELCGLTVTTFRRRAEKECGEKGHKI